MGVGSLHRLHRRLVCPNFRAILVQRLVQAEGNSPKRTTAPTGGPSSVTTELPLPDEADRQTERQVGPQANRRRVRLRVEGNRKTGPPNARASQRIQAGMCPLWEPAGTHSQACQWPQPAPADVFLGIVVLLLR